MLEMLELFQVFNGLLIVVLLDFVHGFLEQLVRQLLFKKSVMNILKSNLEITHLLHAIVALNDELDGGLVD